MKYVNSRFFIVLGFSFLILAGSARAAAPATQPATRPAAKAMSDNVKKGLAWLAKSQLEGGAWGQGDEASTQGNAMNKIAATPNVADTCMVVMAMVRGGSTPAEGEYKQNILKAVEFVCGQIEAADETSLWSTDLRGTRTQTKLGTYVDTFFAAQMLAEVKDKMPSEASKLRVQTAIAKLVKKIEANQKENGQWANEGWAPAPAQAQGAKAVNSMQQNGIRMRTSVLEKAENYAQADFKSTVEGAGVVTGAGSTTVTAGTLGMSKSGESVALVESDSVTRSLTTAGGLGRAGASGGAGTAGVGLYGAGGQLAALNSSAVTNAAERSKYEEMAKSPTTRPADREMAAKMLERFDENEKVLAQANGAALARLGDKQFMAGFGSNGGEEFLSYLNIGESLFAKGGDDWAKWDDSITGSVNKVQNDDGSWTGHHCITGRTFCTAAALQVLMIDRTPVTAMKAK